MTFLLIWVTFAAALGLFAKQRGRGPVAWFLIGTALSPLLGFVLLMMGRDLALTEAMETITHDMEMTHVKCHGCSEYVMPEATACPYCHVALQPNVEYVRQRMSEKMAEEAALRKNQQFNLAIAAGVALAIAIGTWILLTSN